MKKEYLEKRLERTEYELKRLKAILDKDPEEYAKELSDEDGKTWECSDTYPYKVGVAKSIIKWILEENF